MIQHAHSLAEDRCDSLQEASEGNTLEKLHVHLSKFLPGGHQQDQTEGMLDQPVFPLKQFHGKFPSKVWLDDDTHL